MRTRDPAHRIRLIDFRAESPPDQLAYAERIVHDGITVARCRLNPNPGCMIGALQHTVIIHESEPFDLEWQLSPTETLERRQIVANDLHISAAERPVFLRWQDTPKALVIALQQSFVEQVANDVCDQDASALRTMVAIRDPVIEAMAVAWRQELANRGSSGRLYAEHLGLALAIHLLRTYGDGSIPPHVATGGLTSRRLRQITDYMETHLDADISLKNLALIVDLSPHHFSDVFKISTGRSPHQYVLDQRIRRAKELLMGTKKSITEIAQDVGFATHSHFTEQFRKRVKITPTRYRKERQ
jgi:AraC family transcriptional regulator